MSGAVGVQDLVELETGLGVWLFEDGSGVAWETGLAPQTGGGPDTDSIKRQEDALRRRARQDARRVGDTSGYQEARKARDDAARREIGLFKPEPEAVPEPEKLPEPVKSTPPAVKSKPNPVKSPPVRLPTTVVPKLEPEVAKVVAAPPAPEPEPEIDIDIARVLMDDAEAVWALNCLIARRR